MAVKGWLKNKDRRQRRDSPGTLTDNAALEVIQTILTMPDYTKLEPDIDALIRQRDAALVGTAQTFFKRGNENLKVKLKDTYIFGNELIVTLHIQKKQKTLKVCSLCHKKNAQHANFCRYCGEDIKQVEAMLYGDTQVQDMSLSKSREYPFIKYLECWITKLEELGIRKDGWLFPRYHYFSQSFLWYSPAPISIQRFDQILQQVDPTLTSCLFRYGGAENKLRLGYTPYELKEIGGWSSSKMPEIYAQRKGLTPSQKKFTEDNRMV